MESFGWVPHPEETERFVESLPHRSFAQAAPWSVGDDDDRDAFCWRPLAKLVGETNLRSRHQGSVGSCVGNATATATDITSAADIVERKEPEEWKAKASADALYGMSRHIAGMLGNWDGSYGSAAARAIREWGVVHMLPYEGVDLRRYSAQRCREWAARGVPEVLRRSAGATRMLQTTRIDTCEQLRSAMQNHNGANVCSNQGFSNRRSAGGWAAPSGSWAHSMAVVGYRGGQRRGFLIWNSWGDQWVSGPQWPEDMPLGSFWCDWNVMARMLMGRDTFVYASYEGFKKRAMEWDQW